MGPGWLAGAAGFMVTVTVRFMVTVTWLQRQSASESDHADGAMIATRVCLWDDWPCQRLGALHNSLGRRVGVPSSSPPSDSLAYEIMIGGRSESGRA